MKYVYVALFILACAFLFGALDWGVVNWKYHHRDERSWIDHHETLYVEVLGGAEMIASPLSYAMRMHFYYLLFNTAGAQERADLNHWGYDGNPLLLNGIGQSYGRFTGLPWYRVSLLDWYLQYVPLIVLWALALKGVRIL